MGCRRPDCETKLAVGPPTFLSYVPVISCGVDDAGHKRSQMVGLVQEKVTHPASPVTTSASHQRRGTSVPNHCARLYYRNSSGGRRCFEQRRNWQGVAM